MSTAYAAKSTPHEFTRLVAGQHGVFSRAQALAAGIPRSTVDRRIERGDWERLFPGVYRLAGTPSSWRQTLVAACLACGDGAVISHRAAAAFWGLPGFPAGIIELTVPRNCRRTIDNVSLHRPLNALTPADILIVDAVAVTHPGRTLIDIAAFMPRRVVEDALDDAHSRNLVSAKWLMWRLEDLGRTPGASVLRELVAERLESSPAFDSTLEIGLFRGLREANIPEPIRQYPAYDGKKFIGFIDFAYPEAHLAIEAEGYRWHSGKRQWQKDRDRRNALTKLGWHLLQVTREDVEFRLQNIIATVAAILEKSAVSNQPRI